MSGEPSNKISCLVYLSLEFIVLCFKDTEEHQCLGDIMHTLRPARQLSSCAEPRNQSAFVFQNRSSDFSHIQHHRHLLPPRSNTRPCQRKHLTPNILSLASFSPREERHSCLYIPECAGLSSSLVEWLPFRCHRIHRSRSMKKIKFLSAMHTTALATTCLVTIDTFLALT